MRNRNTISLYRYWSSRVASLLISVIILTGCQVKTNPNMNTENASLLQGELIIFHAGSLSIPFKEVAAAFNNDHPDVKILLEPAGSVASARKITDLKRTCDILAVSDYRVIDEMLIPGHATWSIKFATNEMVIAFHERSREHETIDSLSWHALLLRDDIRYGRSDPDQDPCGYRTMQLFLLAEKFFSKSGLSEAFTAKDHVFMRPKEVDLLALLETHTVDYIFIYRSVAEQHGLKYIVLPADINLKDPERASHYGSVSVDIRGREPGQKITMLGEPMVYGLSIPRGAPNPEAALAFAGFLLSDKGQAIMEKNGQPSVVPAVSGTYDQIPGELKQYAAQ